MDLDDKKVQDIIDSIKSKSVVYSAETEKGKRQANNEAKDRS